MDESYLPGFESRMAAISIRQKTINKASKEAIVIPSHRRMIWSSQAKRMKMISGMIRLDSMLNKPIRNVINLFSIIFPAFDLIPDPHDDRLKADRTH